MTFQSVPGVVESMKVVTDENSERVARYAFEYGDFINSDIFRWNFEYFLSNFLSVVAQFS